MTEGRIKSFETLSSKDDDLAEEALVKVHVHIYEIAAADVHMVRYSFFTRSVKQNPIQPKPKSR